MPWEAYEYANVSSVYDMMVYASDVTEGFFGVGVLFSIWSVLFIAFRRFGDDSAFAAASFITFVFSVLFRAMMLVDDIAVVFLVIASAFGVILLMFRK